MDSDPFDCRALERVRQWLIIAALALGAVVIAAWTANSGEGEHAEFPPFKGRQKILVLRVIDGDTFEGAYLTPWKFRLSGIQAPDKDEPDKWKVSKARLEDRLPVGAVVVTELKGPYKYSKTTMAEVYDTGGHSVNAWMTANGYAVEWDGKGERP